MAIKSSQATERLKSALGAGDVVALFSVLQDWPTEELLALIRDVDWYVKYGTTAIDNAWKKTAMEPSLFFNKANAKVLDQARDENLMDVERTASEILSVVYFYLGQRGVKTYTIQDNTITCLLCGLTSHNKNDVEHRYCGNCHVMHEEEI